MSFVWALIEWMTQDLDTLCRIEPPIIRQKNNGIIFKFLFVMNNKHFPIPTAIADERGQKGESNSWLGSITNGPRIRHSRFAPLISSPCALERMFWSYLKSKRICYKGVSVRWSLTRFRFRVSGTVLAFYSLILTVEFCVSFNSFKLHVQGSMNPKKRRQSAINLMHREQQIVEITLTAYLSYCLIFSLRKIF